MTPDPRVLPTLHLRETLTLGESSPEIRFLWGFPTFPLQSKHILLITMFNYAVLKCIIVLNSLDV